jgi:hypothetical protein
MNERSQCAVLLTRAEPPDGATLERVILVQPELTAFEAKRALRRPSGVLLQPLKFAVAQRLAEQLTQAGVPAEAIELSTLGVGTRPVPLREFKATPQGLTLKHSGGVEAFARWPEVQVLAAGRVRWSERQRTLTGVEQPLRHQDIDRENAGEPDYSYSDQTRETLRIDFALSDEPFWLSGDLESLRMPPPPRGVTMSRELRLVFALDAVARQVPRARWSAGLAQLLDRAAGQTSSQRPQDAKDYVWELLWRQRLAAIGAA